MVRIDISSSLPLFRCDNVNFCTEYFHPWDIKFDKFDNGGLIDIPSRIVYNRKESKKDVTSGKWPELPIWPIGLCFETARTAIVLMGNPQMWNFNFNRELGQTTMMGLFCVFVSVPRKINSCWFSITDVSPPVITGPDFWVNGVIWAARLFFSGSPRTNNNATLYICFWFWGWWLRFMIFHTDSISETKAVSSF